MDWLSLVVLAVLQGIAEFLPISSSGHLALGAYWLNLEGDQAELSIVLHAGSLLSILCFYWRRVWALLLEDKQVIPKLIVGTIPAAVLGLFIKKLLPDLLGFDLMEGFSAALTAALMFPVTGLMLLSITAMKPGKIDYQELSYGKVFLVGLFQSFALLPGISRSGSTIVAGLMCGLKRDSAATFSFLLAIPAILGASVLEAKDIYDEGSSIPLPYLLAGAVISFVVGYVSLVLLVKLVNKGQLHWFAMWVIPFGLISAIILLRDYMLSHLPPEPASLLLDLVTTFYNHLWSANGWAFLGF